MKKIRSDKLALMEFIAYLIYKVYERIRVRISSPHEIQNLRSHKFINGRRFYSRVAYKGRGRSEPGARWWFLERREDESLESVNESYDDEYA